MSVVKRLKEETGYSLVEVMVAIMLLAIAIIPMVGMFDAGLKSSAVGSNFDRARALANQRLEIIQALPYNRPGGAVDSVVERYRPGTTVTGNEGIFSYTVSTKYFREAGGTVVEATSDNSIVKPMMQVKVEVDWQGSDYTTTAFVADGGN